MQEFLIELFGFHAKADTITTSQICWRTGLVSIIAIILLRISGRRTFASNSGLEMVVKFMLGAILSRAIAGDSPFGPIVAAAVTLVLFHRLLAYATYAFPAFGRLLKGQDSVLVDGGVIKHHELRRASLSEAAMRAAVRGAANLEDLAQTQTVRLEHDGTISVVKKEA